METKGIMHPKTKLNYYQTLPEECPEAQPDRIPSSKDSKIAETVRETPVLVEFAQAILSNPYLRINLYLIGVLVFSFLGEHIQEYQVYIYTAQPHNVFNDYFVKFGWAWTLAAFAPLALMSGIAYNGATGAFWSCIRIAIATGIWYGCTRLFDEIRTRLSPGLDISGHSFILIWSVMVLVEESGSYDGWDPLRRSLKCRQSSTESFGKRRTRFLIDSLTFPMRLCLIFTSLLSILWDVMFFSTILFYHTWVEKMIATGLAVFAWLLVYEGMYTLPITSLHPKHQALLACDRLET
eukprot:TCALIF_11031-PA protein Name:"Similar to CG10671 FIT family protein CG10671 (Drosophila melanogaster)" AED:0.40 eAED:0.41 QI:0/-1/0/1/-1/1/1/0/293